jgi:hypothetical protein
VASRPARRYALEHEDAISGSERGGVRHIDINSGDLHRKLGGYPGDEVLAAPPKGKGATLTIRYVLPR